MIRRFIKRHFMLLVVTGIFLTLTPQMFTYADAQRGYNAIGGEMFFPFMLWLMWGMVKDTFKEFKQILTESEENEND